jgi:hypothetical protein
MLQQIRNCQTGFEKEFFKTLNTKRTEVDMAENKMGFDSKFGKDKRN